MLLVAFSDGSVIPSAIRDIPKSHRTPSPESFTSTLAFVNALKSGRTNYKNITHSFEITMYDRRSVAMKVAETFHYALDLYDIVREGISSLSFGDLLSKFAPLQNGLQRKWKRCRERTMP
jgi:hypothetical protein